MTANVRRTLAPLRPSEFSLILAGLEESRRSNDYALCGYVLMPDHWHALMWPTHPTTISSVVHEAKRRSAFAINRQRGTVGPFWQHQFWDRFVRDAEEFGERLEYMHFNPVKKGLVARPEDWRWSSYNNFSLDKTCVAECPIQIDYVRLPDGYRG